MFGNVVRNFKTSGFFQSNAEEFFIKPRRTSSTSHYPLIMDIDFSFRCLEQMQKMLPCCNSALWKWRDFIKRHTHYNGCRSNRWSRDVLEHGHLCKKMTKRKALYMWKTFCLRLKFFIVNSCFNWIFNC